MEGKRTVAAFFWVIMRGSERRLISGAMPPATWMARLVPPG